MLYNEEGIASGQDDDIEINLDQHEHEVIDLDGGLSPHQQ